MTHRTYVVDEKTGTLKLLPPSAARTHGDLQRMGDYAIHWPGQPTDWAVHLISEGDTFVRKQGQWYHDPAVELGTGGYARARVNQATADRLERLTD